MKNDVVNSPAYRIESVDNALRLLLELRDRPSLRVAESARLLNVGRSTAHRLLSMLQYRGFVDQDPNTREYVPGRALIEVGLTVVGGLDVRRKARPHLEQLCQDLNETVHLVILEGNGVRFLDGIEGHQNLRTSIRTGMLLPANCTSGGKVLLADLSSEELHALYPRGMSGVTQRSITTIADLRTELERVRQRGYATNFGESEDGIAAVAVCVRDALDRAVAAVAVTAPNARLTEDNASKFAELMTKTSTAISHDLGST
ncbi:IclR family transcriptional regulator [Spiractinospora alimapuensis]|uniref:IclR family transcriptional regulator n=1 Tax=Spiractinospora alimapuensis TaxID=2820884 RepID=UPI001F2D51BC|nr:IclR family transcriptional regulator [Spiractinospora alimapuensis]QVQ53426.1 IclR family transcriptional regulator [Spiractinospora alimapuensis]